MGWSGGSEIACRMIDVIQKKVKSPNGRRAIYKELIDSLEDRDWDTQDEALGIDPVFDEVMREIHSDWDWEED